ncbi:MAG: DUF3737 family protein [Lachnospiraceae bacterium]|nr:DUF3737 family protein [Lachnospiraceae bacterium]
MKEIFQEFLTGERALFQGKDLHIVNTIFDDGESPLKHSENIKVENSMFKWKYPFWYAKHIDVKTSTFFEMARAGIWYSEDVSLTDCLVEAPKEFRRCKGVKIKNVSFPNAAETFWFCSDVEMEKVVAKGTYFGMGSENLKIRDFNLYGDYCFDGAKNVEISEARLLSKDCFWNAENITIKDSFISGEYMGWNSKNITLIDCTVESLQGMCYIDNLKMQNCQLINTTLAFEYSTVEADITTKIDSVINPSGGVIKAEHIDELIIEKDKVDPSKTKIICRS